MGDERSLALSGTTLGNKFSIRRCLGSGGMGAVYEAEHVLTRRVGALKLLHASVSLRPHVVERFIREASAAGRIGNSHIVETLDAGQLPDGAPYMFMELLVGASVRELLERRGRLGFEEAREIVSQAAEGLAAAHRAGIVHRDVKPENLFLCRGEPPYVKLLDFGISRFEQEGDHRLTTEGAPMGTPYYMSPEQVAGKADIGAASDIYSLGVVLYECVTGKVPYDAPALPALSLKIFEGRYEPPSSVLGARVPGLDEVIARAMAASPNLRYATMEELRCALAALGQQAPLSLARTLGSEEAAGLDVTSEGAPTSAPAPATAAPGVTPSRESEPARVSARRRSAPGWTVTIAALSVVGVVVSILAPGREEVAPSAARSPSASSIDAKPGAVGSLAITPSGERPPPLSVAPRASSGSLMSTSAATHSRRLQKTPSPPSRAARDGLTETNPFSD